MKFDIADWDFVETQKFLFAAIVPRPICLVSTVGKDGVFNVAPFASYGRMSTKPPIIYVSVQSKRRANLRKDTIKNILFSKDFVINTINEAIAEPMRQSSADYPSDVDEFKEVGLTALRSDLVQAPRVAESPISMECKLTRVLKFGKLPDLTEVVLGEVLRVHVRDDIWIDGTIPVSKFKPLGKLGEQLYCPIRDVFEMPRPELQDK